TANRYALSFLSIDLYRYSSVFIGGPRSSAAVATTTAASTTGSAAPPPRSSSASTPARSIPASSASPASNDAGPAGRGQGGAMKFARYVFLIAGVYGLLIIAPQYFLEERVGTDYPPAVTHPEYFYGFVGVTLAWQVLYLVIASDPVRYRPVML